jgi:hypothetical protein
MSPESSLKCSGAEEVKVTGDGRKVHKDELYDLYHSLHNNNNNNNKLQLGCHPVAVVILHVQK